MMASGVYVAGFTDPVLKSKENVYDLYVDSMSITLSLSLLFLLFLFFLHLFLFSLPYVLPSLKLM